MLPDHMRAKRGEKLRHLVIHLATWSTVIAFLVTPGLASAQPPTQLISIEVLEPVSGTTHPTGRPIILRARALREGGVLVGRRVFISANITLPDGRSLPWPLRDDGMGGDETGGDGIYTSRFSDTRLTGVYHIWFKTEVEGRTERTAPYAINVEAGPAAVAKKPRPRETEGVWWKRNLWALLLILALVGVVSYAVWKWWKPAISFRVSKTMGNETAREFPGKVVKGKRVCLGSRDEAEEWDIPDIGLPHCWLEYDGFALYLREDGIAERMQVTNGTQHRTRSEGQDVLLVFSL